MALGDQVKVNEAKAQRAALQYVKAIIAALRYYYLEACGKAVRIRCAALETYVEK